MNMLKLWALGLNVPDAVFAEDRVKLAMADKDPVDSMRAIEEACYKHGNFELIKKLKDPGEKVMLLEILKSHFED